MDSERFTSLHWSVLKFTGADGQFALASRTDGGPALLHPEYTPQAHGDHIRVNHREVSIPVVYELDED